MSEPASFDAAEWRNHPDIGDAGVSIETAAWLDVVVHFRAKPRDLTSLREELSERKWAAGTTDAAWVALHARYEALHRKYAADPETLKYRDERKRKQDAAGTRRRGARW